MVQGQDSGILNSKMEELKHWLKLTEQKNKGTWFKAIKKKKI